MLNVLQHYLKAESKYGDDLLEFRELRLFLQTLRATFEFYQGFNIIDVEGDHRISREEFCHGLTQYSLTSEPLSCIWRARILSNPKNVEIIQIIATSATCRGRGPSFMETDLMIFLFCSAVSFISSD